MGDRAAFAMTVQTGSQSGRERWTRRSVALAAVLGLAVGSLAGGPPAAAQVRSGEPDPIDRSRALSTRPVPTLPAPERPTERLVPESRVRDPGTGKEIVIPPHYERPITDQQSQAPPLTGYGTQGEGPTRIPGR